MTKSLLLPLLAASAASVLPFSAARAAANASDNAGNYTAANGYNGQNAGTGFGTNTVTGTSTDTNVNGNFIGSSGTGIDTGGQSFALYSNSGSLEQDTRAFTAGGSNGSVGLAVGQSFSLALASGTVQTGGTVGFNLLGVTGATGTTISSQLTFEFTGGTTDYTYGIGTGAQIDTGVKYAQTGVNVAFNKLAMNSFTLVITPLGSAATTINGALGTGAMVSQFQAFDNNAGAGTTNNVYFNSPAVTTAVPEPSTWAAALAGLGLLGGVLRARRSRHA